MSTGNRFTDRLSGVRAAGGKATPVTEAPVPASVPPVSSRAPSRAGKVVISAYFDNAVRQQFAILAVKQNASQAAMMAEALNLLFEKYGEAPIARA